MDEWANAYLLRQAAAKNLEAANKQLEAADKIPTMALVAYPAETSHPWISMNEARALVITKVEAPKLAERMILEALRAGAVHWRCGRVEGYKHRDDPDFKPGDPAFWEVDVSVNVDEFGGATQTIKLLDTDWLESSARQIWPGLRSRYTVSRVQVSREDIVKHFGLEPQQPVVETPAPPIVHETKSDFVLGVEANVAFLKERYAEMKDADQGYVEGTHAHSKKRISEKLAKQLDDAARKPGSKLKRWSAPYIVDVMDDEGLW
jgi:hypothetical protein